jgi:hypothetical protein
MLPSARPLLALVTPLILLTSCAFFLPPEVPLPPGTLPDELSCGDVWTVDGLTGADAVALDIGPQTNFELVADFGSPLLSMRLSRDTGSEIQRSLLLRDPTLDRALIPGTQAGTDTLQIELLGTSAVFEGTVAVDCTQPSELCFGLTDDDGDGRVDCADLNCAWDAVCNESQDIFSEVQLSCSDGVQVLDTALSPTDEQHSLYRTIPASQSAVGLEFWGGAEVAITDVSEGVQSIEVTTGSPGLVCFVGNEEAFDDTIVSCESSVETDGTAFIVTPDQLPILLEPLAAGWTGLEIVPVCTSR